MDAQIPPPEAATGDHSALDEMRALIAGGTRLTGSFGQKFLRAVHAEDPLATEESLGRLPGNRGVHLYESPVAWAPVRPGERVLDLGCGSGGATRAAADAVGDGGRVLGVDISPEALEAARGRTPTTLPITYRRGDARSLHFLDDRSMDCVVASLLLDDIEDIAPVLAEVFRVLRPGGRFVASTIAFDTWRPMDVAFMGAVLAVVGRNAPGAFAGRAIRQSIPHDKRDRLAFANSGLATVEEQDVQLTAALEDGDDAWRLFSRSHIVKVLDDAGRKELRTILQRRTPHTLYLPIRFMRTRRPG